MAERGIEVVVGKMAESLLEVIKRVGQNIGKSSLVKYTLKYNIDL